MNEENLPVEFRYWFASISCTSGFNLSSGVINLVLNYSMRILP